MKLGQTVAAVLGLTLLLAVLLIMAPEIVSLNETARTQAANSTPGCTSDTDGTCSITLDSAHEYSTTTFMTVTETSPGSVDRTSTSAVTANRAVVSVSGLSSTPTAYLFSVDHIERNDLVPAGANEILSRLPLILVLGSFGVGIAAAVAAWTVMNSGRRRR